MLPRGVDEYLERRRATLAAGVPAGGPPGAATSGPGDLAGGPLGRGSAPGSARGSAAVREARKTLARVDKQLGRLHGQEEQLHAELAAHAADFEKLAELDARLREVVKEREALEEEWLEAAEAAEGGG
jgi:ATP-binding cassette subfamily F protein uup